jgi:hypothetical protein
MISGMTSSALLCPNYRVRLLLKRERQLLFASSSSFFYVFLFSVLPGVFVFFFFRLIFGVCASLRADHFTFKCWLTHARFGPPSFSSGCYTLCVLLWYTRIKCHPAIVYICRDMDALLLED